jgi:hypothetical protein
MKNNPIDFIMKLIGGKTHSIVIFACFITILLLQFTAIFLPNIRDVLYAVSFIPCLLGGLYVIWRVIVFMISKHHNQ